MKKNKTHLPKTNCQGERILFLRPGKLGDMIVLTPILKALKEYNPNIEIAVAASVYNEIVIRHNVHIQKIFSVRFNSFLSIIKLIFAIRANQYDWVIDTTPGNSTTMSIIARFSRSKSCRIAGMHKTKRLGCFNRISHPDGIHIVKRNQKLVESALSIDLDKYMATYQIGLTPQLHQKANEILGCTAQTKPMIGINCSAGQPSRQWPFKKYQNLIEKVIRQFPHIRIVLFATGEHRAWVRDLGKQCEQVLVFPQSDFLTIVAAISEMKAFFTPDTSLLHVAAAFSIPVTGLYPDAGENFLRWKAYKTPSLELVAAPGASVADISVDDAYSAFSQQIASIEKGLA